MNYIKPCYGPITSFMSKARVHPKAGKIKPHQGVDIGSAADNRVWAAAHGVIFQVGYGDIPGNFVLIKHPDGEYTNYSHLRRVDVREGQRVTQGQRLGMKGATGSATGVHLHFEISKGRYNQSYSNKLNPLLHFVDPETVETQELLNKLGYSVTEDGYYGDELIGAVATYQKDNKMAVDGYAGHGTKKRLKADAAKKVAAVKPVTKEVVNVTELEYTSGTLRGTVDTLINSDLQQKMVVNFATAHGVSAEWIEKQKNGTAKSGDYVGLLVLAAIKMLKENQ